MVCGKPRGEVLRTPGIPMVCGKPRGEVLRTPGIPMVCGKPRGEVLRTPGIPMVCSKPRGSEYLTPGRISPHFAENPKMNLRASYENSSPIGRWSSTRRTRFVGTPRRHPQRAHVQERVHDRREQIGRANRVGGRHSVQAVGLTDHLPHAQATAEQSQRTQVGPVIAATVAVDRRRAAKIASDHHQHPVEQTALSPGRPAAPTRPGPGGRPNISMPFRMPGLLPSACMSQPALCTVTKPAPASISRRAISICCPKIDGSKIRLPQRYPLVS